MIHRHKRYRKVTTAEINEALKRWFAVGRGVENYMTWSAIDAMFGFPVAHCLGKGWYVPSGTARTA